MYKILIAGAGGFFGASLRFLLRGLINKFLPAAWFPIGTLTINIIGCLVLGALVGLWEVKQALSPELRIFLFVGICSGFTTYSTFALDSVNLIRSGQLFGCIMNITLHLLIGMIAIWLGMSLVMKGLR